MEHAETGLLAAGQALGQVASGAALENGRLQAMQNAKDGSLAPPGRVLDAGAQGSARTFQCERHLRLGGAKDALDTWVN